MNYTARRLAVLLAGLTICVAPLAVSAQAVRPAQAGFSAERLERIEDLMQRGIDDQKFPGAVTLVARNGRIVHLEAQGLMDVESNRPMQTDAVFRIASMTKPVVAVAVLMMVEEGKMRLTDPASRFVPALAGLSVARDVGTQPAARIARYDVTIRDLLTHTAGFMTRAGTNQPAIATGPNDTLADVLPRLANVELDFEPGTQWAYSGRFAFDSLARAVEVASGMPFDRFVDERIFGPLGMNDTFFYPPEGHPNIATFYASVDGRLERQPQPDYANGVYFSGGGGLFSTAEDYLKFASMLLNGGELDGTRFLSRKTVDLMRSPFIPDSLPGRAAGEGYGLGVRVVTDRVARNTLMSNGSFGWSGAYNTHFFIDPEERVIGIFMTQSVLLATRQELRDDFETAVMQALADDTAGLSSH